MTAQLLAGAPVADSVLDEVKIRTRALIEKGIKPGLGTILVGEDSASAGYVRKKHETCEAVGLASQHIEIPSDASPNALLEAVDSFNKDPEVHAYIIQHPVADGFDFNTALSLMNPEKDADGLHPVNLGKLVLQEKGPVPCTPAGIQAILVYYGIETSGKHVVVIGRGPTLGRPMALLMSSKEKGANAAVTVVHSAVPNLSEITSKADIVIAAVGIPSFVTSEMVRPGSVVISGGISWEGKKLLPDVDESVGEVASWITPRLGGVGPTTVAMLLRNTVEAAERKIL
ncbi:MAG: bifunctional 5,10-methylenetetrahydrofolate dehydrogenase/5,10-methenyltetrahydrofolate cyclohydrolase [Acidimicrobiales bacterium]|jgi:methylenetetrahydrofolate dehydrogenase (NADP+)/methenyltetrahydrofolate cyclohydrolase|nr:MAG: methenyltetrahydrofolate cyclohydrolase [marine actinobacterium MedAcidi-G1]MAU35662.1 bifunctional 5,10-methylene-tetrahydrofolate dehydrogenase/5,10-methylene-tetrahydrofolate cyclohydrolase [Actinomycetota bacterium]MDC0234162.1 bifunctional 5,10-methylene-tetrahydrofolate dehydrogenase/5,10-methylene-tetrahydrofolate cyclohydrolase [Acidimicrobiia bacterium]HAQ03198.1 bifunctional 5,10-methylene-tetrahydrofolate dehydrogenase/5,10-methylene-tetrahydrofolate cyclohydrolase [Acidimicro|tara:strand:+ start:18862 stop:19719 length:858 start_codon:yes stop_codon:yes gene_type:complete